MNEEWFSVHIVSRISVSIDQTIPQMIHVLVVILVEFCLHIQTNILANLPQARFTIPHFVLTAGSMHSAGEFQKPIARCPSETLLNIFRHLTAADVLRLRLVSKQFRDLSCDIGLWRSLYANACVPRPPGPFLWQTYDTLQDILLRSEQLDRTWTSHRFKIVRINDPFYLHWTHTCFRIVRLDRLWFVRQPSYELVCYDFETESESIVWEWERPFVVDVCLDMSVEGPAVFIFAIDKLSTTNAKLLKCKMDDDQKILPVSTSWDVPPIEGKRDGIRYFFSRASTVYLGGDIPLVFDSISCKFYRVPIQSFLPPFFLRKTQLFCIDSHDVLPFDLRFRVFTLPEPGARPRAFSSDFESVPELQLTHEMTVPRDFSSIISPLVHPPLGPVTESTQFKLLLRPVRTERTSTTTYECLTITLPGSSPSLSNDVLPLSMRTQTLFTANSPCDVLYISEDGHARGFSDEGRWSNTGRKFQKFTIDASGDVCHATVGKQTGVRFFERDGLELEETDCLRGKLYCRSPAPLGEELIVMDIE
ncbi:hypothetical protein JVU11DRAFT_8142 [Chiua virens]|nr:hypothetical protein JVU11DRAFT_8142 [Chiua virens]